MVILSNSKYKELINNVKDYEIELDNCYNKIKSYKDADNKRDNDMIEKLHILINKKLDFYDTTPDELDKLFKIYYNLKGDIEDE